MKKNMIALAVAGALVAPVAMAEVTISGGLQAQLVSVGGDAGSEDGIYINDAIVWVAAAARARGKHVVAVSGRLALARKALSGAGIERACGLSDLEPAPSACMANAGPLLERLGERLAAELLVRR